MTEQAARTVPLPFLRRPWPRRALWGCAALLLLALLWSSTALWLPWLVKSQLQTRAGDALGRQVTVQEVRFKPWSLALALRGFALASGDGKSSQLQVEELSVQADVSSLWRLAPLIEGLQVQAPKLNLLRRKDGSLDIDDMLARIQSQPASSDAKPLLFALHDLQLSQGEITLVD